MNEDALDLVFAALASQPRRALLEAVQRQPGCNLNHLAASAPMSRIAVMKHLQALEAAELIISRRQGRERLFWFNATPLASVYERWTHEYQRYFAQSLLSLKATVESHLANETHPSFGSRKRATKEAS